MLNKIRKAMNYRFDRLVFNFYSKKKKEQCIADSGTLMGVQERSGRQAHLIMIKSFFVEVFYTGDNSSNAIESIQIIGNIVLLNSYLEKQFKSVFQKPTFSQGLSA